MTRSKKKRIGKIIYWFLLTVYTVTLIAVILLVLNDWRKYLIAYEDSQSKVVIENYMDNLKGGTWGEKVTEAVSSMEHPFQTNEECKELVDKVLGETLQYRQTASTTPGVVTYNVYCNGNQIGQFNLKQDLSKANSIDIGIFSNLFNTETLCPWTVVGDNFDISNFNFTSSATVTVPATYRVELNGKTVGPEFITESGIKYDVLEPYYAEHPDLPTKVTYHVDNIFGTLEPVVYDNQGNVFTVDSSKDDSQFMDSCPAAEASALTDFAYSFVEPYARFTGIRSLGETYPTLMQYVKPDSDLATRMRLFVEGGADYMNFYAVNVSDINVESIYALGGGFYVINVSYHTVNYADYKTVEENPSKKIIVCWDETGISAVSCQ